MKIFKVNKNIDVICNWQKTRNGFKHVATLIYKGKERQNIKICYLNRTWESYEYESILEKLADDTAVLSEAEKKLFRKFIKNQGEKPDRTLKTIATVAKLGDIFGQNQKEKNDWKARMLKAGLENKGLIMPDDWQTLSENEKEARLNKVIEVLR